MGFSEGSQSVSSIEEIYYEDAQFNINYAMQRGNSFDIAAGYKFSDSVGVELGVDICSRSINAGYNASIPHPLIFDYLRYAEDTGSYTLKENAVYLNFVYSIAFGKFGFDIIGGPVYFLASTELINEIQFSESYPYESIGMSAVITEVDKSIFGFNAGAGLNFYFIQNFGIYITACYLSGSADLDTGTEIPGITLSLGGFKARAGLKILF